MPKVGIGLTTYKDVRSPDFGLAFYQALLACSPKLVPYRAEVVGKRYDVSGPQDFASHWCTELRLVSRPKYGIAPAYTPPSDFGAHWRTKGSLSGGGEVFFGGDDPNAPCTVTLEHTFSAKLGWIDLFRRLVEKFEPAHANLHIFTDRELELAGNGRFAFRAPIIGEGSFVQYKTSLGHWHGPNRWEIAERRRYRFLPELAWANYLGNEFSGRFNRQFLLERSKYSADVSNGILFQITDSLDDVVRKPSYFEHERDMLRPIFADDFFRSD